MIKIFITGESGVIATRICAMAKEEGFEVINSSLKETVFDELKKYQAFKIRKPEVDFTNIEFLKQAFEIEKPDVVIHSGAFVGTDYCNNAKDAAVVTNVYGTKNIVDLCNHFQIPIVYFSTTAIFDPKDYSRSNPITENTRISPRTLYGITKYAGELIVKNESKVPYLIIRPVFGFGDYPNDLHSALTKLCYTIFSERDNKLEILLDKNIGKNYYRVENLAVIVLRLIKSHNWFEEVNIGENFHQRKNWYEIIEKIKAISVDEAMLNNDEIDHIIEKNVTFKMEHDYLHWHNIINDKMLILLNNYSQTAPVFNFNVGLTETIKSVVVYKNITPYWI